MSQTPPAKPNRLIAGRYRLRRVVGQGSMGTVWEAYDEYLHRPVAVKEVRLPEGMPKAEADDLRERTMREARAIAVLSHPNVITLHDVAREQGEPFVVMEYMAARSLAQLLRACDLTGTPLTHPQAALIGDAVAAALEDAHQAGITHRDVKPGNVLVAEDGRVKLTDFGIARNVSEQTMTRTGIMLGSPAYIAPEVASGGAVSPAADLWGLGATLFAATEGHAPYDPNGPVLETISTVVHGEVPRPASAGPLADVITGLMVKEPQQRMTLAQVRRQLRPLLPEPGEPGFDAALFEPVEADPQDATATVTPRVAPPVESPLGQDSGSQLAADPGPLPFATDRPPVRPARQSGVRSRRGALAVLLIAVLALLLFTAAAAGGFALARYAGGAPVLPPPGSTSTPAPPPVVSTPVQELSVQHADAATLKGMQGGAFQIGVPAEWLKFVEERGTGRLPASTRVHFLSADGTQQVTVERFPDFFPDHGVGDYVRQLPQTTSGDGFTLTSPPTRASQPGSTSAQDIEYRTADRIAAGDSSTRRRSTTARLITRGDDLWVISLTVPIEQEDAGGTLFARIAPTFTVTG